MLPEAATSARARKSLTVASLYKANASAGSAKRREKKSEIPA
jgi:hypothetical protein